MMNILVEVILFVVFVIGTVTVSKKTNNDLGLMFAFSVVYITVTELALSLIK